MEKCWFALQQTHLKPSTKESMSKGKPSGNLSIGHIVPSLRQLEDVINENDMIPLPMNIEIHGPNKLTDFKWKAEKQGGSASGFRLSVPIAGMIPGVNSTASIAALFAKKVYNHWEFERLDTFVITPKQTYVTNAVSRPSVKEYLERNKGLFNSDTLYMITGLAVARGTTKSWETTGSERGLAAGVGVEVPALLEVGPEFGVTSKNKQSLSYTTTQDFVWAVRLHKIYNNCLQKDWRVQVCENRIGKYGAVMSEGSAVDVNIVKGIVADHGLENPEIVRYVQEEGKEKGKDYAFIDPEACEEGEPSEEGN